MKKVILNPFRFSENLANLFFLLLRHKFSSIAVVTVANFNAEKRKKKKLKIWKAKWIEYITKIIIIFFLISCLPIYSQGNFNLLSRGSDKIRFQLIENLIIIPVEVNGVELSFLLDSGVSKPILFNLINIDSLNINNVETIFLRGLGGNGSVEALKSKKNIIRIGNAISVNQDLFVVFDEDINFAPRLGIPVHGIIGYDLFKNFIVEINYSSKILKLHRPETYSYKKCSKCETFDLTFRNNKPYIDGFINVALNNIPVKLLIDTGGSDALWLFEDESKGIVPMQNTYFIDFLGKGLSGNVYGKRSKVASFNLKSFHLNEVNAAFPDSASIHIARKFKTRNGSISGELLKRFNIIFDYRNKKITLKKNNKFKLPFYYNSSGIVVEQRGLRVVKERYETSTLDSYGRDVSNSGSATGSIEVSIQYKYVLKPAFQIVEVRKGSPADLAGIIVGDIILSINKKQTDSMKLQDVNSLFYGREGKFIRIKIDRDNVFLSFEFRLEDVFKTKNPQN